MALGRIQERMEVCLTTGQENPKPDAAALPLEHAGIRSPNVLVQFARALGQPGQLRKSRITGQPQDFLKCSSGSN